MFYHLIVCDIDTVGNILLFAADVYGAYIELSAFALCLIDNGQRGYNQYRLVSLPMYGPAPFQKHQSFTSAASCQNRAFAFLASPSDYVFLIVKGVRRIESRSISNPQASARISFDLRNSSYVTAPAPRPPFLPVPFSRTDTCFPPKCSPPGGKTRY